MPRKRTSLLELPASLLLLLLLSSCAPTPSEEPLFRQLAPAATGIHFANHVEESKDFNIIQYLYFYNGGGVAVGDIDNDGLPDLFFTSNQGANALYRNLGGLRFEDITEKAGVAGAPGAWSTGAVMVDIDGDGWLDIYVCQVGDYKMLRGHNELYINNRDGTFREAAAEYGLNFSGFSTQALFFDYDGDGDLDCYLLNHSVHSAENYGTSEIRRTRDTLAGDRLYRNDQGRFVDISEQAGIIGSRIGYGLGVAAGDLDGDGRPDIYVSNDFHENDYLYLNNGDGTFRELAASALSHTSTFSMGSDLADFDNDGRLDIFTLDMKPAEETIHKASVGADPYNIYQFKLGFGYHYQYPRNMLHWNRGNLGPGGEPRFSEIGQLAGIDATDWSWAVLAADFDGDGWQDLFISNGIWRRPNDLDYLKFISNRQVQQSASDLEMAAQMPSGQVANFAFRNRADLTFEDVSRAWGLNWVGCSAGAVYADLDGDGDLDLALNNLNAPAMIFENRAAQRDTYRYLKLRLLGPPGNTAGIGARVEIEADGRRQMRELQVVRGFQSSAAPELIFGLGDATRVDQVSVRWPDGRQQRLDGLAANQTITIAYDRSAARPVVEQTLMTAAQIFLPAASRAGIDFTHRENPFNEFDSEQLAPHMLSTQGPGLAAADVNGDGLDDLYICGAAGQPGALYLQLPNGDFRRAAFASVAEREEVAAVFFDADGDGHPDLYIVSGGGERAGAALELADQLYFNDGAGHFTPRNGALPPFFNNGACAVAFDFDGDGALDLFVGGRVVPGAYGRTPRSYLLKNDGRGNFSDATDTVAPELARIGMVTAAAAWREEEVQRLVIVGEWMPVTVFSIRRGAWEKWEIPNSEGWWNTAALADLDGDGRQDLLLGNLGLNADLRASPEMPVELFVGDFDQNLKTDPIITYYKQGRRYTYATLEELSRQLVDLRKRFPAFRPFAESAFEQVFPASMLRNVTYRRASTFASALAFNEGNGRFVLQSLPLTAQIAPIFGFAAGDFDGDGRLDIVAVGNWHDIRPSLGRYAASFGHLLRNQGGRVFEEWPLDRGGFIVEGQGRAVSLLRHGESNLAIVGRNNAAPLVFRLNNPNGD
jgi:hypothetical protein